ncbi:hypothetical protein GCWU000246_00668 [Jonquetella anthropi E3_33 E1]|nr:hypothetical protein GCWU000246_00668 [Jonquetella anthropi E3_33 E1]
MIGRSAFVSSRTETHLESDELMQKKKWLQFILAYHVYTPWENHLTAQP